MEESGQELKAVVITATAKQESIGGLYAQQKNAISMSSGISADVIRRSPDKNTGEVLKRVSGASVQDNKFIVVRGLSDRYNNAMINNSPLPSSEADRKTFSFDVIPSALIDNVIISKTATPDLPGDFAGGAVQIKTKDFPDLKNLQISYSVGYNSISTFKPFYGNSRNILDFSGFGASSRALPASFPASRQRYVNQSIDQRVAQTKQFDNSWGINNLGNTMPTQSLQLVYGNSFRFKNDSKLGLILSTNYRNAATISQEERNDFNESGATGRGIPLFQYNDSYYNFSSTLGLLANISYIKGNHKFALKNVFNQSFEDNYLQRSGVFDLQSRQKISQQEVNDKSLLNSVLEGEHLLSQKNKSRLSWNTSFSRITNDQPDLRRLAYVKKVTDAADVAYQAQVPSVATPSTAGRFFSELDENIYGASANYTLPVEIRGQSQTIKAGLSKQYKQRNVSARVLGYVINTDDFAASEALLSLPQGELFSPVNIAQDKFYLEDITNPANTYKGSGDLNAGYLMMTNQLFNKLKATWGLRVENYIETLNTRDNSGAVNIDNNYFDILPSINLSYALNDQSNLRASYGRTVARAQFRELAPFSFYDFVTGTVKIGNTELQRTSIDNIDLRYELYPSTGQLISFSVFYKHLIKPIESNIISGSTAASKSISYINAPEADVFGAEVELRHNLGFINSGSNFFKNLVFTANAAAIKSQVNFVNAVTILDKRPLQGQSPYLINTGLQYSAPKTGLQANVLYNRIGRRIAIVGFGQYSGDTFQADYPDIYEAPRDLIDLQLSKSVIRNKGELKLSISNLLDSDANFYQDLNTNKRYDSNTDQLINSVQFGRTISLGFGYRF
nr:TonB-dependent receptor [Pedobacter mongoliensis]